MTDARRPDDVDLRALDASADAARTDAVIATVMKRIRAEGRAPATYQARELMPPSRFLLACAAVVAAIATMSILAMSRARRPEAADVVVQWTQSGHVPTNWELLAAYHGYQP
jgi:hypothetical protein